MKTLYGICGPTASGKSALAIEVCKRLNGEVVSCDSMALYRGMDILTAKPTADEMQGIPHHMIGEVEPSRKFNASEFASASEKYILEIESRGKLPVLCGGTGLYIDALTKGIRMSTAADEEIRKRLNAISEEPGGKGKLHQMLMEADPESARKYDENDVRRVVRSLEIYYATGKPRSASERLDSESGNKYRAVLFALKWDRETLYNRIDRRVDEMVSMGLVDEVRDILTKDETYNETASQAIGYKEIKDALDGNMSIEEAIEQVKTASRHLGKRQETWFKRDSRVNWIAAQGRTLESIADEVADIISKDRNEYHE